PDWNRHQIAAHPGLSAGSVSGHACHLGIKIPVAPAIVETVAPATPSPAAASPPPVRRPKGRKFRLRAGNGEGHYLHMSGAGLVPGKTYAWEGTESQLLALRQKHPEARDMREEVVE
ncbi:MAG: hypothetical protein WD472_11345, partial [Dehalococcoidia bacterium]